MTHDNPQESSYSKTSNERDVVDEISKVDKPDTEAEECVSVSGEECRLYPQPPPHCHSPYLHVQRHGRSHVGGS